MGTAVPSKSQEGNNYILTLIMKAIVAYALAAFAAIAVNPIEAYQDDPYLREYRPLYRAPAKRHALELYEPLEYGNDYKAVLAIGKLDTYSEEVIPMLHEERLTKREDLDTYLDAEADPGYP